MVSGFLALKYELLELMAVVEARPPATRKQRIELHHWLLLNALHTLPILECQQMDHLVSATTGAKAHFENV